MSLEDFSVWWQTIKFVRKVYDITKVFPRTEMFGMTAQIRRAAVSVPANIAEGHARKGTREYMRFLSHAQGSLAELKTQFLVAIELEYMTKEAAGPLLTEITDIARDLNKARRTLMSRVRKTAPNPQPPTPNPND